MATRTPAADRARPSDAPRATTSRGRFPSGVALVHVAMRHIAVHIFAIAAWAWIGWHFFVRTSR